MAELLSTVDLPKGFDDPAEFVRVVELGLPSLEPWWIIEGDLLHDRLVGLQKRYDRRCLELFAACQDNGDVACWDVDSVFEGASGAHGLDPRVTGVRIMDPVTGGKYPYPEGYVTYGNGLQTVNPWTGQTVSNADPWAHWRWSPW